MYKEVIKEEISKIIEMSETISVPGIDHVMETFRHNDIYIYGAGGFGKQIYGILEKYSIKTRAFLDINAKERDQLFGCPVLRPDDQSLDPVLKEEAIVILSIVLGLKEKNILYNKINSYGYKNITNGQAIRCLFIDAEDCELESPGYSYYKNKKEDILRCVDLWADETSAQIYKGNVIAHILRDYKFCLESEEERQYFVEDIDFKKGFSRFIDCGSYIGDTLQDLVLTKGKVEAVVAFEPDVYNFKKLNNYVNQNIKSIANQVFLYPCGVGKETEILGFSSLGGSSAITNDGKTYIQCVAIDQVLKTFKPTFIKMDVEGAEYGALLGAKNMITSNEPDMAICLYHHINHLWDIPLLVDSWGLGYRFHLKAHSSCGMETVMYAVSR